MADEHQNNPQSSDESSESTLSFQEVEKVELNVARLTVTDALNYLNLVKVAFGANSEEYGDFIQLMKEFKANRVTISVVTSRVKVLFANHPELLEGFNQFLPTGFKISVPFSRKLGFDLEEAMRFINRVKEAFPHDAVRYASFLKLLNGHHNTSMSIAELTGKMSVLLQDRKDLLMDFFHFLPTSVQSMNQNAVSSATQYEITRKMKNNSMLKKHLFAIALSVLVAIGMGIVFRVHSTKN